LHATDQIPANGESGACCLCRYMKEKVGPPELATAYVLCKGKGMHVISKWSSFPITNCSAGAYVLSVAPSSSKCLLLIIWQQRMQVCSTGHRLRRRVIPELGTGDLSSLHHQQSSRRGGSRHHDGTGPLCHTPIHSQDFGVCS
ncbi:hypothetical protein BAE44_0007210, partial [Dichanthelium oligosanthes]